jgi:hypothetical protein
MKNVDNIEHLEPYPQALFDAVCEAVPLWISRRINDILHNASEASRHNVLSLLDDIVLRTHEYVRRELHHMLAQDVDEQRNNPLHILRLSTQFATHALKSEGIPEAVRDEFDSAALPDDIYAIGPLTWKDLSDDVHEAGITWGAWKAATVLQRRRAEGKIS